MKSIILSSKLLFIAASSLVVTTFSCGGATSTKKVADSAASAPLAPKASVSSILTEQQFNDLFPQRNKFYTYNAFIKAVDELGRVNIKISRRAVSVYQFIRTDKKTGKTETVRQDPDWNEGWAKTKPDSVFTVNYGDFCTASAPDINKRELAAFFAQIAHETRHGMNGSYTDGLMLIHEDNTSNVYISDSDEYPAVKGKTYYGRGPMQLSYNGNYGFASNIIFGDRNVLLNSPEMVENDPVVAFKAAIYFWMTPETHKPSAHDVMTGKWQPTANDKAHGRTTPGFGMTINIVNGDVECGKGDNFGMTDRMGFYQFFLKKMGITDPNCACSCATIQPYKYSN